MLLFCRLAPGGGSAFGPMINSGIHTAMYSYYFLTGAGYRPSWKRMLTAAQIVQARNSGARARCSNVRFQPARARSRPLLRSRCLSDAPPSESRQRKSGDSTRHPTPPHSPSLLHAPSLLMQFFVIAVHAGYHVATRGAHWNFTLAFIELLLMGQVCGRRSVCARRARGRSISHPKTTPRRPPRTHPPSHREYRRADDLHVQRLLPFHVRRRQDEEGHLIRFRAARSERQPREWVERHQRQRPRQRWESQVAVAGTPHARVAWGLPSRVAVAASRRQSSSRV